MKIKKFQLTQFYKILFLLFVLLIFSVLIFSPFIPESINLKVGDISKETIVSPRQITFESKENKIANNKKKESIKKKEFYSINLSIIQHVIEKINVLFENFETKEREEIERFYIFFESNEIDKIHKLNNKKRDVLKELVIQTVKFIMQKGLHKKDLNIAYIQLNLEKELQENPELLEFKSILTKIILNFAEENFVLDEKQTNLFMENSIEKIKLDKTVFKHGEPIVYSGEEITQNHIDVFKALNMYGLKSDISKLVSSIIFCVLALIIIERYFFMIHSKNYQLSNKVFNIERLKDTLIRVTYPN